MREGHPCRGGCCPDAQVTVTLRFESWRYECAACGAICWCWELFDAFPGSAA